MNQEQKSAVEKVLALREHTKGTGMLTTRAQKTVLQSLDPADLPVVILELKNHQQQYGW